jgi:hypothetical protein
LYDRNPAADANPKLVPSSQPLRHFVINCGEKRTIRETNYENGANSNRAQRPLLIAKFLLLCASLFGITLV